VHRLRRALDPERSRLDRRGEVLVLDTDGLDVDLFRLRDATVGDGSAVAVVAGVRGNLCQVEFPYDDPFADARIALESHWRRLATRLVDRGAVSVDELAPALEALGLAAADLGRS
jgi:hypothetical protein